MRVNTRKIIGMFAVFVVTALIITAIFACPSEQASAEEYKSTVGRLDYIGSTYAMLSSIKITLNDASNKDSVIYSKGSKLKIEWSKDPNTTGKKDFDGGHNMGIKSCEIVLRLNGTEISRYNTPPEFATRLNSESIYDTTAATEGKYEISWNAVFESWGTKVSPSGSATLFIDRTAPAGVLSGVSNGGYTQSDVSLTWNTKQGDTEVSAALDGKAYAAGTVISAEGQHSVVLTDKANNTSTYTFTIDRGRPVLSASAGVTDGVKTNKQITVSVTDTNFEALYFKAPNSAWNSTTSPSLTISKLNGEWEFYGRDKAGNESNHMRFIYDDIAPVVGLRRTDGTSFADGTWINQGVYFDVSDAAGEVVTKLYEKTNDSWPVINSEYLSGTVYYDNATDAILYGSREQALAAVMQKENKKITKKEGWAPTPNDTRIIAPGQVDYALEGADYWEYESRSGEAYVFFIQTDVENFVRSRASCYVGSKNRDMFLKEGTFKIEAVDTAGNVTIKTFMIKLSLPTLDIAPSGYTNAAIRYKVSDPYALQTRIKVDNGEWTLQSSSDLTIAATNGDGTYYFETTDVAGNVVSASVVLDTHLPVLRADLTNGGYTNRNQYISAADTNFSALFYKQPDEARFIELGKAKNSFTTDRINGIWEFYATDFAGNRSETFSFIFDDVAPIGKIYMLNGSIAGAYHNAAVRYEGADDTRLGYLEVFAPGESWTTFGGDLPEPSEGVWQFRSLDAAGNYSPIYSIEIDLTAPTVSMRKNGEGVDVGFYTKANDELAYRINDKNPFGIELDGTRIDTLPNNAELNDTEHTIVALDKAGNRSESFRFIVDKILPTLEIQSLSGAALLPAADGVFYTNTALRVEGADNHFASLCVHKDGNVVFEAEATATDFAAISANFGVYKACVEDLAGNRSQEKTFVIQIINDFGNLGEIYRGYKLNAWFEVTLPSYVFGTNPTLSDISGRYSFERRDDAFAWALAMEELYRVQPQGDNWIYVSAANEAVAQVYKSRQDLDKVIAKYAGRYIGGRKVASVNGNDNYNVIKDSAGRTDESAFIRQTVKLPGFLSEYSALELVQVKQNYVFARLKSALSPTNVNLTYLADDFAPTAQMSVDVGYSVGIKDALSTADALKQGYYLIEETDLCGNLQRYLVYIDFEAPKIRAEVEFGDNTKKELVFDGELSEANAGVFYFLSLEFSALLDNVDDFLALRIEGRGVSGIYVAGDELPILSAETGGGQYTLTVYDRTGNIFATKVNIATKKPSMEYNSLKPTNRQLTLQFRTNDTLNNITKLEIYKINGAGERIRLGRDDLGVEIDFTTLEYNFTSGGKFLAVMTDRYGRVVETDPIFYERGLPYGVLSVSDGGTTNKDVTFAYSVGNAVVVYVYGSAGSKEVYTDYLAVYDNIDRQHVLTFLASGGIEKQFLVYLYSEADDNLFMEYQFGIDTVIAQVTAQVGDTVIEKGGYTNKPFSLWWIEANVRVKYTVGNDATTHIYERGEALAHNGLYTFLVTDRVGNTESFDIYLDNVVEYALTGDGRIVNVGGKYLSNAAVMIKMSEACSEWIVADGKTVSDGIPIVLEGVYTVTIADRFGNRITITIEIDLTPPEFALDGVAAGGTTKNKVAVVFEADAKCCLMRGNTVIREIFNGAEFTEHGVYALRAEDLAGNTSDIAFNIDLRVEYETDVLDNRITTDPVDFKLTEKGAVTIMRDGQAVEAADKYSDDGVYALTATDAVGNTMTYRWTILPKNAQRLTVKLSDTHRVDEAKLNGNDVTIPLTDATEKELSLIESGNWAITVFDTAVGQSFSFFVSIDNIVPTIEVVHNKNNTVSFTGLNKTDATITLTCDGKEIKWAQSMVLKTPGHYVLTLTDSFGNSNAIEFDIYYKLNGLSIAMIVLACIAAASTTALLLYKRLKLKTA